MAVLEDLPQGSSLSFTREALDILAGRYDENIRPAHLGEPQALDTEFQLRPNPRHRALQNNDVVEWYRSEPDQNVLTIRIRTTFENEDGEEAFIGVSADDPWDTYNYYGLTRDTALALASNHAI